MVNRTWIGGGNNKADNPKDWSPTGVPQPGDNLTITQGTIKLTDSLGVNPLYPDGNGIPVETNPLYVAGNVTIDLSKGAVAFPVVETGHATIDVRDTPNMYVQVDGEQSATVDLAANSQWVGGYLVLSSGASLIVDGGPHASFSSIGNGASGGSSVSGVGSRAVINADVTGAGNTSTFDGGYLEFGQSVGSNQIVFVSANGLNDPSHPGGVLQIDQPHRFLGQVQLAIGEIDLMGLATADGYSYQNDMLSLYAGSKVIDTLNLHQQIEGTAPLPFDVERTHSGVSIFTVGNQTTPPPGTLLSMHS